MELLLTSSQNHQSELSDDTKIFKNPAYQTVNLVLAYCTLPYFLFFFKKIPCSRFISSKTTIYKLLQMLDAKEPFCKRITTVISSFSCVILVTGRNKEYLPKIFLLLSSEYWTILNIVIHQTSLRQYFTYISLIPVIGIKKLNCNLDSEFARYLFLE